MDSSKRGAFNRNPPAKNFVFGLILGSFTLYVFGTHLPEALGLRSAEDAWSMGEIARNNTEKLQQCIDGFDSLETKEKDAQTIYESCKNDKYEKQLLHDQLDNNVKEALNKNKYFLIEKDELKEKIAKLEQSLGERENKIDAFEADCTKEIMTLKDSLKSEKDKYAQLQMHLTSKLKQL